MDCQACRSALPPNACFCPSCGVRLAQREESPDDAASPNRPGDDATKQGPAVSPQTLIEWRDKLIDCYLSFSISKELSDWLEDLGLPSTGTTQEKLTRLRQQGGSLVLSAESFPRQTIYYLNKYPEDILAEICQELGADGTGPKDVLLKRIYREVGTREGWLQPLSDDARLLFKETLLPILSGFDYRKDYFLSLWEELSDLLGRDPVNLQDSRAFGSAVIAVAIPDFLQEAQAVLFQHELKSRTVELS